jgi:hypothetical protein
LRHFTGKIFICYRSGDAASHAAHIETLLSNEFGRENVFRDVSRLTVGRSWEQQIREAIKPCHILIAVIGQKWTQLMREHQIDRTPDICISEIELAMKEGIRAIPVFVNGGTFQPVSQLPEAVAGIAKVQGIAFRPETDASACDKLVDFLQSQFDELWRSSDLSRNLPGSRVAWVHHAKRALLNIFGSFVLLSVMLQIAGAFGILSRFHILPRDGVANAIGQVYRSYRDYIFSYAPEIVTRFVPDTGKDLIALYVIISSAWFALSMNNRSVDAKSYQDNRDVFLDMIRRSSHAVGRPDPERTVKRVERGLNNRVFYIWRSLKASILWPTRIARNYCQLNSKWIDVSQNSRSLLIFWLIYLTTVLSGIVLIVSFDALFEFRIRP